MRWIVMIVMMLAAAGGATELVTLNAENFAEYAPRGKEADAIFGDYVLRNDRIVVAIADPTLQVGRSGSRKWGTRLEANIIDLCARDGEDLLGVFNGALRYPGKRWLLPVGVMPEPHNQDKFVDSANAWKRPGREPRAGESVTLTIPWKPPLKEVRYTLADGWEHVQMEVVFLGGKVAINRPHSLLYNGPSDPDRHELTIYGSESRWAWFYDTTFGGAYAVVAANGTLRQYVNPSRKNWLFQEYLTLAGESVERSPESELTVVWYVLPAPDLSTLRLRVDALLGQSAANRPAVVQVADPAGPVAGALVTFRRADTVLAAMRSDAAGRAQAALPPGDYVVDVEIDTRRVTGQSLTVAEAGGEASVLLPAPAMLQATVRGADGTPLPCKLILRGRGETADPDFGPIFSHPAVGNVIYSATGDFSQSVPPGEYELIIMRGPEYHAHRQDIVVTTDAPTQLAVTLERAVDSSGWISADFANFTTHSREVSLSAVEGRLLNLLAEHIEFAPATEWDWITDWSDELAALGAQRWLATTPGIHLTQRVRKTYTAQNVFPVRHVPGAQDGGAPQRPQHVLQVFWVGGWYGQVTDGSGDPSWYGTYERLIQTTPPGIWPQDGRSDGMYNLFYPIRNNREDPHRSGRLAEMHYVDAWEVQPLSVFADLPPWDATDPMGDKDLQHWWDDLEDRRANNWPSVPNRNRQWPRVMRLGYRLSAVVNNNSRHNLHGSANWRNWLRSPTDDPAAIQTADVVDAVRYGHVVMSSGPFLSVVGSAGDASAGPGDDLHTADGTLSLHITVQCPNWIQADRILLIANGMRLTDYDWTRTAKSEGFATGVVQFDRRVDLRLPVDTQLMVMVIGSGPDFQEAIGTTRQHYALSNPIWVNVGDDSFKPHSPIDDAVYTYFDTMTPAQRDPTSAPCTVRLYLRNLGDTVAADDYTLRFDPPDAATIVGSTLPTADGTGSYSLAPDEEQTVDYQIRLNPDYTDDTFTVYIPRSSVGSGRRAVGRLIKIDKEVDPWTNWTKARRRSYWWLPEHVKDRPAHWGVSKMKRLDPNWVLPTP